MQGCALFDLDGTLIDEHPGILAGMDAAVRALGHAPDLAFDLEQAGAHRLAATPAEVASLLLAGWHR